MEKEKEKGKKEREMENGGNKTPAVAACAVSNDGSVASAKVVPILHSIADSDDDSGDDGAMQK